MLFGIRCRACRGCSLVWSCWCGKDQRITALRIRSRMGMLLGSRIATPTSGRCDSMPSVDGGPDGAFDAVARGGLRTG